MEARWMAKGMAHSKVVSIETTSFSLSKMFNPALMFSWCLLYIFSAEKKSWVTFCRFSSVTCNKERPKHEKVDKVVDENHHQVLFSHLQKKILKRKLYIVFKGSRPCTIFLCVPQHCLVPTPSRGRCLVERISHQRLLAPITQ